MKLTQAEDHTGHKYSLIKDATNSQFMRRKKQIN
jgi:hypothetical protein